MKVLPKRFCLNLNTIGFNLQTQKLELHTIKKYGIKVLPKKFHLNGNTIGYHPLTQTLELCTK